MQNAFIRFVLLIVYSIILVLSHRWTKAHELLIEQEIRKDHLAMMVNESDAMLRWENFLKHIYAVEFWHHLGMSVLIGMASSSSLTICTSTMSRCSSFLLA